MSILPLKPQWEDSAKQHCFHSRGTAHVDTLIPHSQTQSAATTDL